MGRNAKNSVVVAARIPAEQYQILKAKAESKTVGTYLAKLIEKHLSEARVYDETKGFLG